MFGSDVVPQTVDPGARDCSDFAICWGSDELVVAEAALGKDVNAVRVAVDARIPAVATLTPVPAPRSLPNPFREIRILTPNYLRSNMVEYYY